MGCQTEFFQRLTDLSTADEPFALATIVKTTGSVPNAVGAKMLVDAQGQLIAGTIGGGRIEHECIAQAAEAIAAGRSQTYQARLTPEQAGGIGMNCGGSVEVFIDVQLPRPHLILCGAGHINIALAAMARGLEYELTVVDPRVDWLNRSNYPDTSVQLALSEPAAWLSEHGAPAHAFIIIATPEGDLEVMRAAATTDARYVGVVASKRKSITLLRELAELSMESYDALVERYRAPIGLDLGGRQPQAVALSILAEIQAERFGASAASLAMPADRLRELVARRSVRAVTGS